MFGVILNATNSSSQKGMFFVLAYYMKKIMKLLAFKIEQPSYNVSFILYGNKLIARHARCIYQV